MDDHWLVRPQTIRRLWFVFIGILVLTVLAEFVFKAKGHFGVDGSIGFNAWYGLGACIVLIIGSKVLGVMLKRPDTYYGDAVYEDVAIEDTGAEDTPYEDAPYKDGGFDE